MSISDTHACSAAKLVRKVAGRIAGKSQWMGILGGGARRDRTDDLKLAKLALSQLSYGPVLHPP